MRKLATLLTAALICSAGLSGCLYPQSPDSTQTIGGTGSTGGASAGGGSQTGGGGGPLLTPSFSDPLTADFPGCDEPLEAASWRAEILRLVNRERALRGLSTLVRNQTLEEQATQYACEMIHYDFFAHENPATNSELQDRAEQFGYDYSIIGENLAAGQRTAEEAFEDWMNSQGHRENILNPRFEEIGIGIRSGGDFGLYWVQEFGAPFER